MIDLYCERLGPGLWAEPLNAVTNLSFMVAAIAIWRLSVRLGSMSVETGVLIGLMLAIGAGSGLFHTVATRWAYMLDIIPILLFQLAFLWFYGRRIMGLPVGMLALMVVIFIACALYARQFPHLMNGSFVYVPALLLLTVLGTYHYLHARKYRGMLLGATLVFSVSLFFRTIDLAICESISVGTHFLWHVLNGLVVYMSVYGLQVNRTSAMMRRA